MVKKEIFFIGDSRIKCVNGRGFSGNNSMKVKSHPGATTDDFIDYVWPTICKQPNFKNLHTGVNDIQNNVNVLQK